MSLRDHEVAATIVRLAGSCDGAVLGLAFAAVAATSWVKYLATSAVLGRIETASSAPISGLRSLLAVGEEESVLVVVRGRVQPGSSTEARGIWGGAFRERGGAHSPWLR